MKCPKCGGDLHDERSSGYDGYRCSACGHWFYETEINPPPVEKSDCDNCGKQTSVCLCDQCHTRLATVIADLLAACFAAAEALAAAGRGDLSVEAAMAARDQTIAAAFMAQAIPKAGRQ